MVSAVSRTVECFYPGNSFPAISVTGAACSLNCKHCMGKYLTGMVPACSPEELVSIADALAERGARGFLLSGGADRNGKVCLSRYARAVREIKSTTDLRINAHVGLMPRNELEELVSAGVDSFSVDVYGDERTIREVLGLNAKPEDYISVISDLMDIGASAVAPHICIGIHGGELVGEFDALQRLSQFAPALLVLISLVPTKGTAYEAVRPPGFSELSAVLDAAKHFLPGAKLVLGCMRSKRDRSWEAGLVQAGLDGIVLPSPRTVENLRREGLTVRKRAECCALL
ncbi:MAG: radical SAM protein [Thermoplasmata archaeon]